MAVVMSALPHPLSYAHPPAHLQATGGVSPPGLVPHTAVPLPPTHQAEPNLAGRLLLSQQEGVCTGRVGVEGGGGGEGRGGGAGGAGGGREGQGGDNRGR